MRVSRKKSKKPIIITIILLFIFAGCVAAFLLLFNKHSNNSSIDTQTVQSTPTEDENTTKKVDNAPSADSNNREKEKNLPIQYEGETTNNNDLTGVITSKSVTGETLIIRNTINQIIGSGTCTLTLSSGDKTITKSAEIIQNPSSSTCAGFDIPLTELSSGQWGIEIKISSDGKELTLKDNLTI